MQWSLDELRELDEAEYDALIAWAEKRGKPKDDETIDADEMVKAMDEKKRKAREEVEGDGVV